VIGISCALEVRQVTRNAGRRRDVVIVVYVAIRTLSWRHRVRSCKREVHGGVVETGGLPGGRRVARLASLREVPGHVIGIRRSLKIFQVTRNAGRRRNGVIVIDVAIRALPWRHRVRSRKWEVHGGVVETGGLPACGCMACLASLREVAGHMVRVR